MHIMSQQSHSSNPLSPLTNKLATSTPFFSLFVSLSPPAHQMRDRMERFVLLPFTVGCISESSIAVGMQREKRSKTGLNATPTREKEEEEEEYLDDEDSLSGDNLKSPLNLVALPRLQKLFKNFKNFSQLFVYKDELEEETGMEIGFPTDVKHVTHIGLDGGASSILSKGWNNLAETELINLSSFPLTPEELTMARQAEAANIRSLLEAKCRSYHNDAVNNEQTEMSYKI